MHRKDMQMTQTFEDASKYGKEFLDSGLASLTAVTRDAQAISGEASNYAKQVFETGTATVEKARLAVNTVVDIRHPLVRVIADNVLPCLTPFTEDRASIIFIKGTDAFDGVRLFLVRRDRVRDCAISDWGARRSGDRIRIRGGVRDGEGGGICHSPTDYPLSNHNKMKYERSDAGANPSPFKEHIHKRNIEVSVCRGQAAGINIQTRSRRSRTIKIGRAHV